MVDHKYFKEWGSPLIAGIKWVSETAERASGTDVFSALSSISAATDRIVTTEEVNEVSPDIIITSRCGKKVMHETYKDKKDWSAVSPVTNNSIYEI